MQFICDKDIHINNGYEKLTMIKNSNNDIDFVFFLFVEKNFRFKESDELYPYFLELYNDIIKCNIVKVDEYDYSMYDDYLDDLLYSESVNSYLKKSDLYKELVKNYNIIWNDKFGDSLKIRKEKNEIVFSINKGSSRVRIGNNSKYGLFNQPFIRLFENIENYYKDKTDPYVLKK